MGDILFEGQGWETLYFEGKVKIVGLAFLQCFEIYIQ